MIKFLAGRGRPARLGLSTIHYFLHIIAQHTPSMRPRSYHAQNNK
ncbi:MAG: hypothetical protein ACRBBN_04135 [Methyloligellaceae bacterium]